ncbi:phosphotransferase [Bacillus sp. FSL K6-3431]|uniref:phosphotransferase n=1 Tax=Bacillus sp. FSL K6-3431 TaxID=2921500 RepID=UPI0030F4FCFD
MQSQQQMIMRKMMNKHAKLKRDGFSNRLLLFIKKNVNSSFTRIKQIKVGVWLLSGKNKAWIVKEFSSLEKLELQMAFTAALAEHAFYRSYTFYPKPLIMENRKLALIQYIKPKKGDDFNYQSSKNIKEALILLGKFHGVTSQIASSFKDIPQFNQIIKWKRRLNDFNELINQHKETYYYPTLQNLSYTGEWALERMKNNASYFTQEPHCIIHGDVADHNFIRDVKGNLNLIDFDLIAIAPSSIDLLQFCNRILPSLKWKEDALFRFPQLLPYRENKSFLTALIYPTDIFREWNQFFKRNKGKHADTHYMENMTFHFLRERMEFYKTIMKKVDTL